MATIDTQAPNSSLAAEVDPLDMEQQQETSLASLPIIDLSTPGFDDEEWCRYCFWDGKPDGMFESNFIAYGRPGGCVLCHILWCLVLVAGRDEGEAVTQCRGVKGLGSASEIRVDFDRYPKFKTTFGIFISSDHPQSAIDRFGIPRRHISQDNTLSQASYEWAQRRIAECVHSHQRCQSQGDGSFLPTRLVNLQPDEGGSSLRLDDQGSIPAGSRYIALSYCWGDYNPTCMTTAETLEQQMKSIPWGTLPRTFQDAAKFALSLGIKYLWIDSMCIIQGDREDWQREAGKMYAIYKNSHVTFAALFGPNPTSGLRTTSMRQTSTPVAQLIIAQETHTLYARRIHHLGGVQGDNLDRDLELRLRCPLLSRAWAYQERIVSPRVIFFSEDELVYQCLSDMGCECGATIEGPHGCEATRKTDIFLKTRKQSASDVDDGQDVKGHQSIGPSQFGQMSRSSSAHFRGVLSYLEVASTWRHKVVAEYSQLRITKQTDRLAALAAIAEQFQSARQGEDYLAGLWSGSLLWDLLWFVAPWLDRTREPGEGGEKMQRSAAFPTWSWACLQHRSIEYGSSLQSDDLVPAATIVEAWCRYAKDNAFGVHEIERSKLVLRSRILHCRLKWILDTWECNIHDGNSWIRPRTDVDHARYYIEMDEDNRYAPPNTELCQEVYIMHLLTKTEQPGGIWAWYFLVLRPESQEDHVYTRGGYFYIEWHQHLRRRKALPPSSFVMIFKKRSTLATCEIR